jgi:cyclic pyranopterin monophosphate synthase
VTVGERANEDRPEDAVRMVEVGGKEMTERRAVASCVVSMTPEACARLIEGTPKGDPLEAARVAGLLGAKRTPELLPFCHPVAITGAEVAVEADPGEGRVTIRATVRARDRTGVEMEALTACALAALSIYDTTKAYDRAAVISDLKLLEKEGGKSGQYRRGT